MAASPTVSVVTVLHNRSFMIAESVGSLLVQTLRDIEIIVIDDGSTDDADDQFARLSDPRLRIVRQPNAGFTASINRAVRLARAPYIAVHGAGDVSLPDRLARQAAHLDAVPRVGAVGCARIVEGRRIGPAVLQTGPMLAKMLDANPFSHGEVMFRRHVFDRAGGYREVFRFAQDRDLWLRMGEDCDYAVLPEVLYERRFFAGSVSRTPRDRYLQTKFSQFAVQCARHKRDEGIDLLDTLGPAALLLTEPTRAQSRLYTHWGLRAFRANDHVAADFFLRAGWREHKSLYTGFGRLIARIGPSDLLRPILTRLLTLGMTEPPTSSSISR